MVQVGPCAVARIQTMLSGSADPWMRSRVRPQIDPRSTATSTAPPSSASGRARRSPTRVNPTGSWLASAWTISRPVPPERRTDRVDRRLVATFAEVRNRLSGSTVRTQAVQEYDDRRAPKYADFGGSAVVFVDRELLGWKPSSPAWCCSGPVADAHARRSPAAPASSRSTPGRPRRPGSKRFDVSKSPASAFTGQSSSSATHSSRPSPTASAVRMEASSIAIWRSAIGRASSPRRRGRETMGRPPE